MKPITIFHASDLHYSPTNLAEADRCFGFAVEDGTSRGFDVAIITGDTTDHRLEAHSPTFLALARRIKQLADHAPVFLLQGTFSHEPAGMLNVLAMIGAKHPIIVSETIQMIGLHLGQWQIIEDTYDTRDFNLVVSSVPTVNKADLALLVGADHAGVAMGEHIAEVLRSFNEANRHFRSRDIPTVLVSHGTVDGSLNENGVPMAGLDHEFSVGALFSAGTSATMLGHIHKHQAWHRHHDGVQQAIAYPGSAGRFHYGEIGEKYYLRWELTATTAVFVPVETPSRRMIELQFDGAPNLEELATVVAQCAGAYVRVRYNVDEEYAGTIDRNAIKDILGSAAEVKIEGSVLPIQRQRCAGISSLPSLSEKFLAWCTYTSTPSEGLIDRLQQLESMEPEDIANEFAQQLRSATPSVVDRFDTAHRADVEPALI